MAEKRAGIFIYYEWLSVSPSLVSTIRYLEENGYFVDVFHLYNEEFGIFKSESDKVNPVPVRSGKIKLFSLIRFLATSVKIFFRHKYSFLIGVDQEGIIVAGLLGKIKTIPYIYYSLEIVTREDVLKERGIRRFLLMIRKSLENYFSKNAAITIAQDKYRADILIGDNDIDEKRILFVPNSYYFKNQQNTGDYTPDFLIPTDKKIVIYTGSIIPEMAIEEIVSHMDLWPKDTILIMHTPYRTQYLEKMIELIKKNNLEQKIIISVARLSFEEHQFLPAGQ
jgi:hypothetical protein